jgi:hypothetical protein
MAFLARSSIFAVIAVLVIVPGWCGGMCLQALAQPAAKKVSCCHRPVARNQSDAAKTPARHAMQCCCARSATLPEKVTPGREVNASDIAATSSDIVADFGSARNLLFDQEPLAFGPRLHVLLRVWRI